MTENSRYWFPAKRYGWGWGLPNAWQGWVVMAVFAALLLIGAGLLLPKYGPPAFVAFAACLCVALVAVCWIKGEPPAWRWGWKVTDPWHAHVYFDRDTWTVAEQLHQKLNDLKSSGAIPNLVLVGKMYDKGVGPHPKPQFEIQFLASALPDIDAMIRPTGLTALIHPLTDDDLADHTTLAEWIGQPLPLDETVLDPPGKNQGIARFGKVDY